MCPLYFDVPLLYKIEDVEISTPDKLTYQFHPITSGALTIDFRGPSNCHIALAPHNMEQKPICEMIIGGWDNTASVIRLDSDKGKEVAKVERKNVVTTDRFVTFYIHWSKKGLSVRLHSANGPILMEADNCIAFPVHFFACRTAWGATGSWKIRQGAHVSVDNKGKEVDWTQIACKYVLLIKLPFSCSSVTKNYYYYKHAIINAIQETSLQNYFNLYTKFFLKFLVLMLSISLIGAQPSAPVAALLTSRSAGTGPANWVPVNGGAIPPNAIEGGVDGETLFIGRAEHEGALIPGKVVPSHGVCYVAWGGAEVPKSEYEVLCDAAGMWVPCSGQNVPGQALEGGRTEDGEPLYVGRANHEGTMTVGKVQGSHGVCYIPYGGQEVAFNDYEVFIVQ